MDSKINLHESLNWLDKLILNLKLMQKRPELFFRRYPDYDLSASFTEGFLHAFSDYYKSEFVILHGKDIWTDISEWYMKSSDHNSGCLLSDIIKSEYKHLKNEALIQLYLNTLIDFFESKKAL